MDGGDSARTAEDDVLAIGRALHARLPPPRAHPLRAVDDKAMALASSDATLRAALFRFVDVAPACHGLDDLARHLTGFLGEVGDDAPAHAPVAAALKLGATRPGRAALGAAAAAGVKHMAHRFIVGEDVAAATPTIRALWERGVATSVDLLGEATITAEEADRYAARCAAALDELAAAYADAPDRPLLEADGLGPIPRANLSVKVSALTPLLRPDAPRLGQEDAGRRLTALFAQARAAGAHLHVDMESLDSREAIVDLALDLLADQAHQEGPSAGVVLQAYLVDSPQLCERLIAFAAAHARAHPLVVRLVKGAYWDHEVVEARQHGWAVPVFERKADCDRNFEALTRRLLEARAAGVPIRPAIASHNLRSVAHAIATTRALGLQDRDLELQVLRGLGDDLQDALAATGFRVRAYCPVGDLVAGMAYLVRRLLENTSNESFLADQAAGKPVEELLAAP